MHHLALTPEDNAAIVPMLAELAKAYETIEDARADPAGAGARPVAAGATCWSSWRSSASASRRRCA